MTPAQTLRELLTTGDLIYFPVCFDALSARLVRDAGFKLSFMSGFMVAATRLGLPDTGLISFGEMLDQLRNICRAVPDLPIIADGDTGYGNAMNVRRTVMEYARAGAACVLIEDQTWPKRCGHVMGKQVISRQEARMKIRAAVEARKEEDILILARTDALGPLGFEAALERCHDFQEEGADILFMEALQDEEEMRRLCAAMEKPILANMFVGGGAQFLPLSKFEELGFKLVADPTLFFAATRAIQDTLRAMSSGDRNILPPQLSFKEMLKLVGLTDYLAMEERYKTDY